MTALDAEVAADGIDEVCQLFLPFSAQKDRWPPEGSLFLACDDGHAAWRLEPEADGQGGVAWHRGTPGAIREEASGAGRVARVTAPVGKLFFYCWGRWVPSPAAASGDPGVLEQWRAVLGW